jgi:hypothetical protein
MGAADRHAYETRHGATDWPSLWPRDPARWPEPPIRWTPERSAGAVIICQRTHSEFIGWADIVEARAADRELYGQACGPGCHGVHTIVWTTPGRVHVAPSAHQRPLPAAAAEIAAQYARYRRRMAAARHSPQGR